MIDRLERVKEAIKREVSIILQNEINDPRIKNVAITEVEITRDMRLAKIFYFVDDEADLDGIKKGLVSAGKYIRNELAKRLDMKYSPKVSFRVDTVKAEKERIELLFEKLKDGMQAEEQQKEGKESE